MRFVLVAALVLVAAPAAAQDAPVPSDRALRISFAAAITAHGLDVTTTAWCRAQGTCREANPALRWAADRPLTLGLAKMGTAAAMQLVPYHLARRGHLKAAFWFNVAQTCVFTSIAIRNARHAR